MKTPILLLAALGLSGCALSTIPVPAELSTAPKLSVQGRQGWNPKSRLTFGPYRTGPVDRSATWIHEHGTVFSTTGEHEQTYAFVLLQDDQVAAYVDCWADARATQLDLPVVGEITSQGRAALRCDILPAEDTTRAWVLEIESNRGGAYSGFLRGDDGKLEVQGTRDLADARWPTMETTGLYIRREGRALAAVELVNHGGVWLDPSLDGFDRDVVAGAAAALLAFEALAEDYDPDRFSAALFPDRTRILAE
jgi:hypothetical protein